MLFKLLLSRRDASCLSVIELSRGGKSQYVVINKGKQTRDPNPSVDRKRRRGGETRWHIYMIIKLQRLIVSTLCARGEDGVMNWHVAVKLIQHTELWGGSPGTGNLYVPCHLLPFCLRSSLSTPLTQGHTNALPHHINGLFRIRKSTYCPIQDLKWARCWQRLSSVIVWSLNHIWDITSNRDKR